MDHSIIYLIFFSMVSLLFSCTPDENPPLLKIYTIDDKLVPIHVYLDGDTVPTVPAFGSEGTISLEVTEGTYQISAASRLFMELPPDTFDMYSDGFFEPFLFNQIGWQLELTVEKGI